MRSSSLAWLAAAAALSAAGQAAASTVLVDQPYQAANAGGYSNLADFRWADPIKLAADSTVSQVTWYGSSYNNTLSGTVFDLDFYSDDGAGSPGATVAHRTGSATLTDQGVIDRQNGELFLLSLDIAPVALSANTNYFFSIAAPRGSDFVWDKANDACCTALSGNGGLTWSQHPVEKNAFSLIGDVTAGAAAPGVPEPGAWALMLTGFFGAGAMLRRRMKPVTA